MGLKRSVIKKEIKLKRAHLYMINILSQKKENKSMQYYRLACTISAQTMLSCTCKYSTQIRGYLLGQGPAYKLFTEANLHCKLS